MKPRKNAFTMVELLTVVSIIALLMAVLIPALTHVRNSAKKAKQKAQFTKIELALETYKNDFGDYPESELESASEGDYGGTQKLTEALMGQDLLGFHPDSDFNPGNLETYYPGIYDGAFNPGTNTDDEKNLEKRVGPYLDNSDTEVYKLENLFPNQRYRSIPETYVLCDTFHFRKIKINDKNTSVGTPLLYYRANSAMKQMDSGDPENSIYNMYDNDTIYQLDRPVGGGKTKPHPLEPNSSGTYDEVGVDIFYYGDYKLIDPQASKRNFKWPYRPDSYIIISAGLDGLYGTQDDMMNFEK